MLDREQLVEPTQLPRAQSEGSWHGNKGSNVRCVGKQIVSKKQKIAGSD